MITIVDYGLGNIRAFLNAYRLINVDARAVRTSAELAKGTRIILPGVGAFDQAMGMLNESGMRGTLDDLVLEKRASVLGVCVGMQMLAHTSEEGQQRGLGWIPGRVRRLSALDRTGELRVPHMGWNDVYPTRANRLFAQLEQPRFYFLHSFYFEHDEPEHVAARVEYGAGFSCAVNSDNIFGVQFHPEKSHHDGMRLLQNFAEM